MSVQWLPDSRLRLPAVCERSKVREVTTGGTYYKLADPAFDSTKIQVGPLRSDINLECANLCLLGFRQETDMVRRPLTDPCNGFAIDGDLCTLLYPADGARTERYEAGKDSHVYSVAGCV